MLSPPGPPRERGPATRSTRDTEENLMRTTCCCLTALAGAGLLAALLAPSAGADDKKPAKTLGTIERLDPRFDKLIGKDASLEVLAGGFQWTEGPVWIPRDGGFLLFSDIPNNRIVKWREGE